MAFSIFDIFRRKSGTTSREVVDCFDMIDPDGLELQFREAAFWGCVNLIANAVGKCEVKEFRSGKLSRGPEWYLWNVSPNKNQNASAFWHKLVSKAFAEGDTLVVQEPYGTGMVVADSFNIDDTRSVYAYTDILIGKRKIARLPESEVLYLRFNHKNMEPLIRKMAESFLRMMKTAMQNYLFNNGQHWKVHVDQVLTGDSEWRTTFAEIMDKQIRPFLDSASSVLPEMDGYTFSQISGTAASAKSDEVKTLATEIWTETGRAFLIPSALTGGNQQDTTVANRQFLTDVIDPIARMIEQEINRKRFTVEEYLRGDRLTVDTSAIVHFDIFANAANVEKIIGSGVKSVNELRALIGDAAIDEPWADQHFMTLNIGSAEKTAGGGDNE